MSDQRSPAAARVLGLRLALAVVLATGCAPTERYYTNKTPEPVGSTGGAQLGKCESESQSSRLQSRASNQRSVEGFGSFPCTERPDPSRR